MKTSAMTLRMVLLFGLSLTAHSGLAKDIDILSKTLSGAMTYLEATQIKPRPGKGNCRFDSSSGDGCRGNDQNITGEWANDIHPLFLRSQKLTGNKLLIADSNMFVTGAILYPLYWVKDSTGHIDSIRRAALSSIKTYKKGDAYSFWPSYINRRSGESIVGPINLRFDNVDISNSVVAEIASNILGRSMPWVKTWMTTLMNKEVNPDGFASFLNVPNDSDDTSVAMALLSIQAQQDNQSDKLDLSPLLKITEYRDISRSKSDARDFWTPKNSGAYLTWMKDENAPLFGDYPSGVMPLGVNNVDCVVNANVVFALSLNNQKEAAGYSDSLNYLAQVTRTGQWLQNCALYYPQKYTFAYSVTRAYRDGGARSVQMDEAMDQLMLDLLARQDQKGKWCLAPDKSCHYSTALALTSLLNLGENRAIRLHQLKPYSQALVAGFRYLYKVKKDNLDLHIVGETEYGYTWDSGLFFSAEDYRLGVWRSNALTNALIVEAIAKYKMNYQKSDLNLNQWNKRYLYKKDQP